MDPSSSPENTPGDNEKQSPENKPRKLFGFPIIAIILALTLLSLFWVSPANYGTHVDYSYFWDELQKDNVAEVEIDGEVLKGTWRKEPLHWEQPKGADGAAGEPLYLEIKFNTVLPSTTLEDRELLPKLRERNVKFDPQAVTPNMGVQLLAWLAIPALFLGFFYLMMRRSSDPFGGGGMMGNFIKSPAKRFEASDQHTTFDDVAAMENAKLELQEIVEFLKNPARFQRLGAEIPKGVLLMGSPGTGKTLLARATAGEAGVPFYSINGSEFIQMFVGVGASRVRDLFRTAKENSPCILFVDEIDAVGRVRGAGVGGGHDEREQTLNQILSEMDGFEQSAAVIVLAATNRPDVLDPALLRPGRFDRHISVEKPAKAGREGILKVHCRKVPLADTVDLGKVAAGAVGFSGAELKNLVNEAALHATRAGKDRVDMEDFELARDRVIMGPRREEILSDLEKKNDRLSRSRSRADCVVFAICRSRSQSDHYSSRTRAGSNSTASGRRTIQHWRIPTARPTRHDYGRPSGRETCFRRILSRCRRRPETRNPDCSTHGRSLGHERNNRPRGIPSGRRASIPRPRNAGNARIQ